MPEFGDGEQPRQRAGAVRPPTATSISSTAPPWRRPRRWSASRRAPPAFSRRSTSARPRPARLRAAAAPSASGSRCSSEVDFVATTRKFYQTHADDFDQLIVFTNTRTTIGWRLLLRVHRLRTRCRASASTATIRAATSAAAGRLRSIVNMDALSKFPDDPRQRFLGENNTLSVIGQECGHRWLAYMEFRDGAVELAGTAGTRSGALELLLRLRRVEHGRQRHPGYRRTAHFGRSAPCRAIRRWINTRWACAPRRRCRRCSSSRM